MIRFHMVLIGIVGLAVSTLLGAAATFGQAALAAHPGRWTSGDLQRTRMIRNCLDRPWGHRGPTPEQVWKIRQSITPTQRSQLNATVHRYQQKERTRRGIPTRPSWAAPPRPPSVVLPSTPVRRSGLATERPCAENNPIRPRSANLVGGGPAPRPAGQSVPGKPTTAAWSQHARLSPTIDVVHQSMRLRPRKGGAWRASLLWSHDSQNQLAFTAPNPLACPDQP